MPLTCRWLLWEKYYSIDLLDRAAILQYDSKQIEVKTIIVLAGNFLRHTIHSFFKNQ